MYRAEGPLQDNEERCHSVVPRGYCPCGSGSPTPPRHRFRYILVTLCRFDHKPELGSYLGPFIPCERRLAQMRILEIQGRAFATPFLKQGLWQASSLFSGDTPGYGLTLVYY